MISIHFLCKTDCSHLHFTSAKQLIWKTDSFIIKQFSGGSLTFKKMTVDKLSSILKILHTADIEDPLM